MIYAFYKKKIFFLRKKKLFFNEKINKKTFFFLYLYENYRKGIGECLIISDLEIIKYENEIIWICNNINKGFYYLYKYYYKYPLIKSCLEQAFLSLKRNSIVLFPLYFNNLQKGIKISAFIINSNSILNSCYQKINQKFKIIKLKIEYFNNIKECIKIIKFIKFNFPNIKINIDINGSFTFKYFLKKIYILYKIGVNFLEQPLSKGQYYEMFKICQISPIKIFIDEDFNLVINNKKKIKILNLIQPKYVVLRPALCGGFFETYKIIQILNKLNIKWKINSSFESNLGLYYLSQWIFYIYGNYNIYHGLDTLNIYNNDIFEDFLKVKHGRLFFKKVI